MTLGTGLPGKPQRGGSAISHLLHTLISRVWQPRAKLQLIERSRSPYFLVTIK